MPRLSVRRAPVFGMVAKPLTTSFHLGVAPDMVREIVGHSDLEVTITIYAHTALDEKRPGTSQAGRRADLAKQASEARGCRQTPRPQISAGAFWWSDWVGGQGRGRTADLPLFRERHFRRSNDPSAHAVPFTCTFSA
jgi:hypothetical protein